MISLALIALLSSSAFVEAADNVVPVEYEIPAPHSLKAFARVTIPYQISYGYAQDVDVRYTLPAILLGHDRTFELQGNISPGSHHYELHGADVDMSCQNSDTAVTCKVIHHDVTVDLPAVKAALDASELPKAEKEGRFQLASFAARMGGDLVGVISYLKSK